jgi:phosphatidylinositol alpha-1,6-mannosyltransferase
MKGKRISFLVLTAFSNMGGIEKFNRAFMKALDDLSTPLQMHSQLASMHDSSFDVQYTGNQPYVACNGNRILFVLRSILNAFRQDVIILGHINLALIGVVVKLLAPHKKVVVICHGVEVFTPVGSLKKTLLRKVDHILAVSSFTKQQLMEQQQVPAEKITIFPNTIDPFFTLPQQFDPPAYLQQRYQIAAGEKVIFTLTRINRNEGYKGYDTLIRVIPALKQANLPFKYILGGKADAAEQQRIQQLIRELQLEEQVIMPGFISDEEIADHYRLADVFAMPSKKEGFGIVYLEAMACGLPVIAGNKDGSTEALQFGKLGTLIDPDNPAALTAALMQVLRQPHKPKPLQVQGDMLTYFSFERFRERLAAFLTVC